MIENIFSSAAFKDAEKLTRLAEDRLVFFQSALEKDYGDTLLGIEDEFTVHGIDYRQEQALIEFLSQRLSSTYGSLFSSIDREHPLMRVRDSVAAGQNGALHMPDTFRLELVINHFPDESSNRPHAAHKAQLLSDMRRDIWHAAHVFDKDASLSWSPRPISNVYDYLTQVSHLSRDEILERIKQQAEERPDLIGRDNILSVQSLEELLLDAESPIDNEGAAGSGVHINIGFTGKEGVNPFYNSQAPDKGTFVTWNASAGIIDVTSESILPFINLAQSSWRRIGNPNLSASSEARYHPLKKGGAIVKQNPHSEAFYKKHNIPHKDVINEKNAHLEVRHCDGGVGVRDGSSLIMLQLAATFAGIYHGLEAKKIHSYDELLEYRHPLCADFDEAVEKFRTSDLMRQLLGEELQRTVIDYVEDPTRALEEVWALSEDEQCDHQERIFSSLVTE